MNNFCMKISQITQAFVSEFISAYIKSYSSNYVLVRFMENWKKSLDQKQFVGMVLMDLSKGFDSVPQDLLIAKIVCQKSIPKVVSQ